MTEPANQTPTVASDVKLTQAKTVVEHLNNSGPAVYAVFAGALYVLGFLVLNANLAKNGIVDYEFVDARYILSGAVFAFFLICFYLFAGRTVVHTPRWLGDDIKHYQNLGLGRKWHLVIFIHSLVYAAFACCLSAALFSMMAFGNREAAFFYTILGCAFIVLYAFDTTNRDLNYPRIHLVVSLVIRLIAVIAFFANQETGMLGKTFGLTLALFCFINLALDTITRHGATADRLSFSGVYGIVMLLTVATAFGTTIYGQVSSKIGGARPQNVLVALTKDTIASLPPNLVSGTPPLVPGKLIHQTEQYLYLLTTEQTIRVRNSDVVALVVMPERQQPFWSEFIASKARTADAALSVREDR